MNYISTIGLEIHVELKTKSKMFSTGENTYGMNPNTKVTEIDLGLPGVLPIVNKEAINLALKACLAFNCNINSYMCFDRKNYFYPDLPKGYQITQAKTPIGYDGYIEVSDNKIRIERIHIEEDTGKTLHYKDRSLLNYNRAGIPLIEIVTKPDIQTATQAKEFLTILRENLLYLNVSDVKMSEGSMRCDVNISLRKSINDELGTKIEIKNLNSINNVVNSIEYEIKRQSLLLDNNESLSEETRRYNEEDNTTILMRKKETNNDYRYFMEPDLPPIILEECLISDIKNNLPILPNQLRNKYITLGISNQNIEILISNINLTLYLEKLLSYNANPIISSNLLTGDISAYLNKNSKDINELDLNIKSLVKLIDMVSKEEISNKVMKELLFKLLEENITIEELLNHNIEEINDEKIIVDIICKILDNNSEAINDYKTRKERTIKFIMGLVMKETKGKVNPKLASKCLIEEIERRI